GQGGVQPAAAGRAAYLGRGSDRRSAAARRQCRRRAARLDRHARRGRRQAAEVRHAADGARARLRGLELELSMSVYAVNYLCRELLRDHAFRAAMKADPAAAIAKYDLTAEERQALLAGDVAKLYRLGRNAVPPRHLPRS